MKLLVASISIVLTAAMASACRAESLDAGAGTTTCGQFASNYAKEPEAVEAIYFAWAQGFMTGMNHAMLVAVTDLRDLGTPRASQKAQIRSYCRSHPLDTYADAVVDLFASLPSILNPAKKK